LISYDRNRWWRTAVSFQGTVLPHTLGRVGLFTLFCLAICLLDDFVLDRYGWPLPALDQLGHTVMGVTMSLLIVHRTNSANTRYWEGRTAWGSIVNASRNLARLAGAAAPPAEDVGRLLSAFAVALRERLRDRDPTEALRPWLSGRLLEEVVAASNPPARLGRSLSNWVRARKAQGAVDAVTASDLERQIAALTDAQGACERIQRTPMPFIYASLIKELLVLYLASLPFVLVAKMGYAAPMVVAVVALGMLGIEDAGVEIENPFGMTPNALPLETICATIARDCAELVRSED
jgi:ion channel-forming bestrophin family protein